MERPVNENKNSKKHNIKSEIFEWIKALVLAFIMFFILNLFISTTTVYSTSMYPTLIEGDRLLLYKTHSIQRGDIVSFKSDMTLTKKDIESLNFIQRFMVSDKTHKNLIKRVIGIPGDEVYIENGIVYINGEKLDEPYMSTIAGETINVGVIPDDEYFMMGDNRGVSLDSRQLGSFHKDKIIGKTILRFYPIDRFGTVD